MLYEFLREGFADPAQEKVLEDAKKLIASQIELTQKVQHFIRVPLKKTKRKFVRWENIPQVTLYLTNEEQERIEEFSKAHYLNRHATIKRAIRKMLGLKIKELHHQLPNRS